VTTNGVRPVCYDRGTVALHWAVASLVGLLWVIGRLTGLLPKGPLRVDIWSIHALLGFVLAALIVGRIGWRLFCGRRLAPPTTGPARAASATVHGLLYVLMVTIAVLGVLNVFGHGFPLFGAWSFPRFWHGPFQRQINEWHDLAANLIAAVAALHAAAALFHHYVLRDGVLRRMVPGLRAD
jgi:cytochrome b561